MYTGSILWIATCKIMVSISSVIKIEVPIHKKSCIWCEPFETKAKRTNTKSTDKKHEHVSNTVFSGIKRVFEINQ